MIRLIKSVWKFIKADFSIWEYGLTLLWASGLLLLNYSFQIENDIIERLPTNGLRFGGFFLLYGVAYYGTVIISTWRGKDYSIFTNKFFWLVSAVGLAIFSSDNGFVLHQYIIRWIDPPPPIHGLIYSLLSNGTGFITIAIPLFIANHLLIPNQKEKLGLNAREINFKPFATILLCIAPIISLAAFESGLNNYYPTYKFHSAASAMGVSNWVPVAFYELLYGLDFFNVELCFRGFFVVGMTALLGRKAVLPMAVFYCTIHFGKPPLEAISSLFGGYILGAITYQTRSIWGGVMVHIGLAWMMELAAFLAKWQSE